MQHYMSDELCDETTAAWTKQCQTLTLVEELAELQKELLKHLNRGKDNLADIAAETADVLVLIDQVVRAHGIEKIVDERIQHDINHIHKLLGKGTDDSVGN